MKETYFQSSEKPEKNEAPQDFRQVYSNAYGENLQRRRNSLNEQYDHPEIIKVKDKDGRETGETIEVVDIKPDNLKDEVPIVYFKGFSSGNEAYRNFLVEMGMLGNRVIAMENPHGIDSSRITDGEKKSALQYQNDLPDIELRKTAMVLETLEHKEDIQKIDIVAHSEGAIYSIIFAMMHPEKVRSIILMDPAGFIKNDSFLDLIKRSVADANLQGQNIKKKIAGIDPRQAYHPDKEPDQEELKQIGLEAQANSKAGMHAWLKAWTTGPLKNIEAIQAIANSDITPALEYLRKECNITIGMCHGVEDATFDNLANEEGSDKRRHMKNLKPGMLDLLMSTNETHTPFTQNPGRYAPAIDLLRTGLKKKWQKKQEDAANNPG